MRAVFLDRDGTINQDPGYIGDPEKMRLLPGAPKALSRLKSAGYELVVVSNQSGVGRGLFPIEALEPVHRRMNELLSESGVKIDHFYCCIHRPDEGCECRKPKAKLLLDAAADLGIDLSRSFMVGDKLSDLQAGRAAGVQEVLLVRTGYGSETEKALPPGGADFIADDLEGASERILQSGKK